MVFKELIDPSNSEVSVIAEMSGNHQSSLKSALQFVEKAIRYEADVIKFQVYKPETITLKSTFKDLERTDILWSVKAVSGPIKKNKLISSLGSSK